MFGFWRKKDFQETKDLEQELETVLQKNNLLGIGFFGIGGTVKGLSLFYKGESKDDLKLFAGIISEIYREITELDKKVINQGATRVQMEFGDRIILTVPITDVVIFISVSNNRRSLSQATEWIEKNRNRCSKIFSW